MNGDDSGTFLMFRCLRHLEMSGYTSGMAAFPINALFPAPESLVSPLECAVLCGVRDPFQSVRLADTAPRLRHVAITK